MKYKGTDAGARRLGLNDPRTTSAELLMPVHLGVLISDLWKVTCLTELSRGLTVHTQGC